MTDEPLTYGPDMFYSDVTLPDPTTVLNEPLPRAWSQGGMIEAVGYDEALQYVTLMYPEYSDNPRRQKNEAQNVLRNVRRDNGTWGDVWTPWGTRGDEFKQWAEWKRKQNRRKRT